MKIRPILSLVLAAGLVLGGWRSCPIAASACSLSSCHKQAKSTCPAHTKQAKAGKAAKGNSLCCDHAKAGVSKTILSRSESKEANPLFSPGASNISASEVASRLSIPQSSDPSPPKIVSTNLTPRAPPQ